MYDVIIIGAGPAGLAAGLLLGRCRRRVLVCDAGRPRNYASNHLHAFLTRDGISPAEFRQVAREELRRYPTLEFRDLTATDAHQTMPPHPGNQPAPSAFTVLFSDGSEATARALLLATGQMDVLPPVEGAAEYYGRGVYHCPICDGWENRDQPWAAYGRGPAAADYALELLAWTSDLVLCTDGPSELGAVHRNHLARNGVAVREERLQCLEGDGHHLQSLAFATGERLPRHALFFWTRQFQRSDLPARLGCSFDAEGAVQCNGHAGTGIPGLFVAGNARPGLQLSIIAAAEGTEAGYRIHMALDEAGGGR